MPPQHTSSCSCLSPVPTGLSTCQKVTALELTLILLPSGIGLGIGERLIDEFLATRSLTSHLILIPTTRSVSKSTQTIQHLRAHANKAARTSKALVSRAGGPEKYNWEDTASRVHILSPQLDLCDIKGIYAFAEKLCDEPLSNPAGLQGQDAELQNVRIPRLDSVICNAAYGSWVGVNYPMAIWVIMTEGLINSVTWPKFKIPKPTALLNGRPIYNYVSFPPYPTSLVAPFARDRLEAVSF